MPISLYTNVTVVVDSDCSSNPGAAARVLQSAADGGITLDHIHVTNNAAAGSLTVAGYGVTVGAASAIDQDVRAAAGPTFDHLHITNNAACGSLTVNGSGLTVEAASVVNQDLTTDAGPILDHLHLTAGLVSDKNGTGYNTYGFVPLASPLTSTSFDGDSFSTTGKTFIDLSAAFGAPAGLKAIAVYVTIRDSGSAGGVAWVSLAPDNSAAVGPKFSCSGVANDAAVRGMMTVPCDANGDVYYEITATGSGTLDLWIQVWGYFI